MRIVYLLGTAGGAWGGLERHTLDLAAAVAEGHEVHLLADAGYRPQVPARVHFHPCAMARSRYSLLLWWQLRRLFQRLGPEVVHAQGGKAARLLAWHRGFLRRLGAVTIGSVHGTKSGHGAYAGLDGVIAVSADIAARIDHPQRRVIANGIAPVAPDPAQVADCQEQRRHWPGTLALAIGRLAPVKGFDLLLQAWPRDAGAHLLILGDGPERAALEAQCQALGLASQVTFLGHSTAVAAWLRVADVMVMSSRREGFPYVLVEALQAGCPILSTDVSGVRTLLAPQHLAPVEDVPALNRLLTAGLSDVAGLRQAQQPLFARAREELTLQAMARTTVNFYQSCRDRMA